eukprot:3729717-Pleurochrysis_carterae.AAC.3
MPGNNTGFLPPYLFVRASALRCACMHDRMTELRDESCACLPQKQAGAFAALDSAPWVVAFQNLDSSKRADVNTPRALTRLSS